MLDLLSPLFRGETGNSIGNILKYVHMREKGGFLKNIAHPAARNGKIHSSFLIKVNDPVEMDCAGIGLNHSCDCVECQGLTCTGRAEENSQTLLKTQREIQGEVPKIFLNMNVDHG
jgi:hypothetical protein